jgi:hypothetical protein
LKPYAARATRQKKENDKSRPFPSFGRLSRFCRPLSKLEQRCPDHVEIADWQQAVEDGRAFLARWGRQAERLGWTPRDLFGLAPIPDKPSPSYRRLARVDHLGLIWILRGRPVVALTNATATIRSSADGALTYRRELAASASIASAAPGLAGRKPMRLARVMGS